MNKKYNRTETGKAAARKGLLKKYGLSAKEYADILQAQNGVCAVCQGENKDGRRLFVDHCHDTGKVRGLLCGKCNSGLGLFNDNTEVMLNAIDYLVKSRLPKIKVIS